MDILFSGNLSVLSSDLFKNISDEYKCILFGDWEKRDKNKNIFHYAPTEDEHEVEKIFTTFDFEVAVYVSRALDGRKRIFDELQKIESILYECKKHEIKKFIYITTNDMQISEGDEAAKEDSRYILLHSCEELCRTFAKKDWLDVIVMRVPYIYGMENRKNYLCEWVRTAAKGKKVMLPGNRGTATDFLCDEDLGILISRIIDEPPEKEFVEMNLSGENEYKMSEVQELIEQNFSRAEVELRTEWGCVPKLVKNDIARKEYGWYPTHVFKDDFESIAKSVEEQEIKAKKRNLLKERYRKFAKSIRITSEVTVTFAIAELLNYLLKDNVIVNFMDFRIIAVVIMGTMNGLIAGVAAAALACLGYIAGNVWGIQWQILFYNVQNWIPFASYLLLGSISGYIRDKHNDMIQYEKEEFELLEQKYVFLTELYNRVLENKDRFNSQIISYKNSFGKLYAVVKQLNTTFPEEVFYKAVSVLEDMLENHSVAIYSMAGDSDFARLNVCSKGLSNELGKSVKLSDYPELYQNLKENKVFINTGYIKGCPQYATPIFKDGTLLGMIVLMYADNKQMTMEFSNEFTIITKLIRDSIIRAMEFDSLTGKVVLGTQILKKDAFAQILAVRKRMNEKQYTNYTLLKIGDRDKRNIMELSEMIEGIVRNNDILGLGEDEELYLLLSQTKADDIGVIAKRLNERGINFEIIKD